MVFVGDLIKTINDDDEVPDLSENSESEDEAQPKKNRVARRTNKDFEAGFSFAASQREYMTDTWNDVSKYIKKQAKTSLDEKIAQVRQERRSSTAAKGKEETVTTVRDSEDDETESDESLSDDELIGDEIKVKQNDARRKTKRAARQPPSATDIGIDIKVEQVDNSSKADIDDSDEENDDDGFFDDTPVYDDKASFALMNLSRPLLKAIEELKYVHPTPIQAATIPVALLGRDICGCAATGTGKTAAYMLPVLERLLFRPKEVAVTRVLVLVPTRELGVQVYQVTKQLAQFTSIEVALSVGGLDLRTQEAVMRRNPDIVIATPGRLIDHVKNTPTFSLESIEVLILDEADRMLDECFLEQMKEIVRSCARTRQTLLFSATMTDQVNQLATVSLNKPVKVFVDSNKVVAWNLRQEFVRLRSGKESDREALLAALVCRTFRDHTMVFIQTKQQCHRLHILLGLLGVRVGELHGNMSQPQRLDTLKRFRAEELDVLLATDVAARGLDIRGVKTVINFTMPTTLEHYIHRVGRTARAGRAGRSVSLAGEAERKIVREIVKRARDPVKARLVPPEIVAKYRSKLANIEPDVNRVLEEEQAEREIARLENRANRLQNTIENGGDASAGGGGGGDRTWFQTKKERLEEAKRLKKEPPPTLPMTKKMKKKAAAVAAASADPREAAARRQQDKDAAFVVRQAKRSRKQKRIRAVVENEPRQQQQQHGGGKKRKASSFDTDFKKGGNKRPKFAPHGGKKKNASSSFRNKKF